MADVLIIDDDKLMCKVMSHMVKDIGYGVKYCHTIKDGMKMVLSDTFDVVMLDVRLPDGNGLDILPKIREVSYSPEVIIITGIGDQDGAELAINSGAWDYIEKPASIKQMTLPLLRAVEFRKGKKDRQVPVLLKRGNIIGNSSKMNKSLERIANAASINANVLINGETGTGKELFARAIHENSSRADKRFVVVDCAALPDSLVESILFGHEKGSFTGADKSNEGLVKQADGGTLFLDEIGELPLTTQKAFLRVIQERQFRSVGSKVERKSDFRLIAATHQNLDEMVEKKRFRHDLLFRLRSFTIDVPPLRERSEDIKDLVFYYTNRFCEIYGIETKGFSPGFIEALKKYNWPGNIRELVNMLEQTLAETRFEPTLFPYHLPTPIRVKLVKSSISKSNNTANIDNIELPFGNSDNNIYPKFKEFKEEMEKQYLKKLVSDTNGVKKDAIKISGLSRQHLYDLLKKYGL
ncbi:sigma-54-dependent transcriptional regulator [Candidatus Latescibacterota bacterium]